MSSYHVLYLFQFSVILARSATHVLIVVVSSQIGIAQLVLNLVDMVVVLDGHFLLCPG